MHYATRLHKKKNSSRYASGAEYSGYMKVAKSGDHSEDDIVTPLKNELILFGPIGSKLQRSSIGFCAEAVAVNRVLIKYPTSLSKMTVGRAIRIKTLQIGKKCIICRNMF